MSEATEHHDDHGHHGPPLAVYYQVFTALVILTLLTIAAGQIGLEGSVATAVTLTISTIKATLVCRYFMLLGYSDRFYSFVFILSLAFLALLFIFTSIDWSTRDELEPDMEHHMLEYPLPELTR